MSTVPARPPRKAGRAGRLLASFWVADIMVVSLLAFFIIVGGGTSPVAIVIGCILALLYAGHAVWRHRHRGQLELSPESRHDRERRGF